MGVTTTIKAYSGQPKFSGIYDEDLENIIDLYTETAENCDATPEEKRKALFTMLIGNARSLFARNGKSCVTFEDGTEVLRKWFKSTVSVDLNLVRQGIHVSVRVAFHVLKGCDEVETGRV